MSTTLKYVLLIALVLLLASIPLAMQRDTGGLDGVVTDGYGPVVKASVEARNTMNGAVFRVESDAAGHYTVASLPQGRYSLWVKAPGHDSEWIREVIVNQGRTTHRDVRLGTSQSDSLPTGE